MHKARAFFFVCAGLLCLALAYHLGARSATAQAGSTVTGMVWTENGPGVIVMTPNGDCYFRVSSGSGSAPFQGPLYDLGNFWSSGATPAVSQPTWGQVKAKYATPAPETARR